MARCTIANARELSVGPVCSPLPFVWLIRFASSATSFQYRIASISFSFVNFFLAY